MRVNIILFMAFLFILPGNTAANTGADSLRSLLNSTSGKNRIPVIISLMGRINQSRPAEAIQYGKEALQLLNQYPDDELRSEIYFRTGWAYSHLNNTDSARYFADLTSKSAKSPDAVVMSLLLRARIARNEGLNEEALKYTDLAFEKIESIESDYLKSRLLNEKGSVLRRLSRYDEAYSLHRQALSLLKNENDDEELRVTYTYLGIISDLKSWYDEALRYHLSALDVAVRNSDKRSQAGALNNIGIIYYKIDKSDNALEYYKRALDLWRELNNTTGEAATLNGIGAVYEEKGMYKEALDYYRPALSIWEKTEGNPSVAIALQNIGAVYSYLGNYKESSGYLKRGYDIYKRMGDQHGMGSSLNKLAYVYNKLGRTEDAVASALEGIRISEEIGNWPTIRHAHQTLGEIYENNGRYKEALDEFKKYQAANDTIFNSERQQVLADMQAKYESEEQKKQIEILQRDASIQAIHRNYLITGVILLFILVIVIYSRYRLKQRAHLAFEKLHEAEVESSNLRAEAAESKAAIVQAGFDQKTKELNAARDLQLSMLPSVIPSHNDFTVAAKMITATEVGGDYYDFHKAEDNSFTIAIGDATGHGARAGIMVTAIKSLFTLLAGKENIDEILCRSTRAIKKMNFTNLFMAFALLRIKGNELEYVGAGMPSGYILRWATGEIEELQLKGLPLGIAVGNEYRKLSIMLNRGDTILLTSDGLPELFNHRNESLGYEQVPLLLKESAGKTPEEIVKHITGCAEQWLSGIPQHDDMTIVALKMNL